MAGKVLRRSLASLAGVALLAAAAGCHLLQTLGEAPSEEEVAAYQKLPYFKDGRFQSPEPLPSYPERSTGTGPSGWIRFALPNPHAPDAPIPKVALDVSSFAAVPADLAVYWLGHSSLIVELEGKRLLVDPVFGNAAPIPGIVRRFTDAPLERDQIPPLDYVLITHDHYDHLEYATMRALRDRDVRFVVPYGVGAHLRKWGIPAARIHEVGWGEAFSADDLTIASERTLHYSGRTFDNRNKSLWTSWALKGRRLRVFISGDSGYGEHFREIGAKHGPFDLAFIEIDAWNPGWPKTHMFPEEVIRACHDLGARALVPAHWGVFDLARHPWDESIRLIADLAAKAGDVKLLTPLMGERLIPNETVTRAWWKTVEKE
ncbi:MAG: MBL fold metallo-hydrolase [Candidatus Accumulibacter sp.]|jgi:L-ascorbate metabolism protein UlaG (beta-lactamase superfamily)|nr:MBL fold metallo-hydrolase [Accumulibacter sp.]